VVSVVVENSDGGVQATEEATKEKEPERLTVAQLLSRYVPDCVKDFGNQLSPHVANKGVKRLQRRGELLLPGALAKYDNAEVLEQWRQRRSSRAMDRLGRAGWVRRVGAIAADVYVEAPTRPQLSGGLCVWRADLGLAAPVGRGRDGDVRRPQPEPVRTGKVEGEGGDQGHGRRVRPPLVDPHSAKEFFAGSALWRVQQSAQKKVSGRLQETTGYRRGA